MLIFRLISYIANSIEHNIPYTDTMTGEFRTGNDLEDGGRGLMQALFRNLGGGNEGNHEKSQYGYEQGNIRIQRPKHRCRPPCLVQHG